MRRRWSWPILEVLRGTDAEHWIIAWYVWFVVGFLITVLPALIVDSRDDVTYLGTYLLIALIAYGLPLAAGVMAALGAGAWWLLTEYGTKLIPRRVTEPVRQDLRDADRRLPPDRLR